MTAISRQSSKAPAPHRFVDQFKTRGKHNEIQKRAASSSESGDVTKLQPFQRRHARNGPQGTSHSSASQSGFPLHATQCVGTIGSDWSGPTIHWVSLRPAGTRYHPCQHWPLPGPNHDQHRAKQSSTGRRVREPPLPRRSGRVSQHRDRRPVRASRLARSSSDEPGGAPTCAGGDPS